MFDRTVVQRLMAVVLVIILVASGASCVLADSVVVYSTLGPGDSYSSNDGWTVGLNTANSDAFTPSSTVSFNEIDLALNADNVSSSASIVVQLRADNSGLPGSVLESFAFTDLPVYGSVSSGNLQVGESVLHPELVAGTQYWVTASNENDSAYNSAVWNMSSPGVTGLHYANFYTKSVDEIQGAFRIEGSAVPEPSTLALLGSALLGLVACHRLRGFITRGSGT